MAASARICLTFAAFAWCHSELPTGCLEQRFAELFAEPGNTDPHQDYARVFAADCLPIVTNSNRNS